jgi:hypothetical protein
MPDTTFETLLSRQLRAYAEAGVRPIDRFAIAEETIAGGRSMPRWRRRWSLAPMRGNRVLIPLLVGLLLVALAGGALLVGSRLQAPKTPPRTYLNELVSAPDLSMPMAQPALVPLLDGRVLVIGDDGNGGGTGTRALVYDPATGVSEPTGPLVSGDSLGVGAAVRLTDGKVLAIGNAVAQVFDPATMSFTLVGPMVTPRADGKLALLRDGRVLMAGGTPPTDPNTTLATAELFDPATGTFSATGSMATTRSRHSMTTLADGRVLVAGGGTADGDAGQDLDTAEIYDASAGTFTPADSASQIKGLHLPVLLSDGRVVLIGQRIGSLGPRWAPAAVFDPVTRTFAGLTTVDTSPGTATLLGDGRIFLTGWWGSTRSGNWSGIYDPASGEITETGTLGGWAPSAARLADGRVLIVGGLTDGNIRPAGGGTSAPGVSTVEIFQ